MGQLDCITQQPEVQGTQLRMRLLVDMNLSPRWVTLFSGVGIEAAHWSMIGAHDAPEPGRRR